MSTAGYAGYDGAAFPPTSQPAQNIRFFSNAAAVGTLTATVPGGGLAINSLNMELNPNTTALAGANSVLFTGANDVLNLTSGGLIMTTADITGPDTITGNIGTAALPGKLTAGGVSPGANSDLYVYYYNTTNTNPLTINSQITDNANGSGSAVRFVAYGGDYGIGPIILANANNNYTGGTIVSQQTLTIAAGANLPGNGLTINGGTVTQTATGVLTSQAVTLNGGSVLNLNTLGSNALTSLTFNNNGGTATPTVAVATGVTLSLPGGGNIITASSANVGTTATISTAGTGAVDFAAGSPTITVNPIMVTGTQTAAGTFTGGQNVAPLQATLNISALLQNTGAGGISVAGGATGTNPGGVLQLGSTLSTFGGGVTLSGNAGLIIGASSTPSTVGATVTAGPLGTGTLTVGAGSMLISSNAANTLANNVIFSGDPVFNGFQNLTLNGTASIANSTTATVVIPQVSLTLGGVVAGFSANWTKQGLGTFILANAANNITGAVTINQGVLGIAADGSLGANTNPITINGGALGSGAAASSTSRAINFGPNGGGFFPSTGQVLTLTGLITSTKPIAQGGAGTTVITNAANGAGFTAGYVISGGTLAFNGLATLGSNAVTLSGGTLSLLTDGASLTTPNPAGTSQAETIVINNPITVTGNSGITVGRQSPAQFAPMYTTAANKDVQIPTLTIGGSALTATANNGYDLQIPGAVTLIGVADFRSGACDDLQCRRRPSSSAARWSARPALRRSVTRSFSPSPAWAPSR